MLSPGQSKQTGLSESGSSPVPIIPSFLCCPQPLQHFPRTELIVDDEEGLEDEADADEGVEEALCTLQAMFIACCDESDSMEPFSDGSYLLFFYFYLFFISIFVLAGCTYPM